MTTNTMVALQTVTVTGSAASTVNFDLSSVSGYTDLKLVCNIIPTNGGTAYVGYRVGNGSVDTGSNYSYTGLYGTGSAAGSYNGTSDTKWDFEGTQFQTSSIFMMSVDIMNYANTTTYKTAISRSSRADTLVRAVVGLWRSTSAINKIQVFTETGNASFGIGSTFTIYGIANADIGAYATGGVITQDANYYYHAFGNSSYFTPTRNLTADILVVAGGGGGGSSGGGGAGGVLAFASQSLTNGTGYTCTIGAGGAGLASGTSSTNGNNGGNSSLIGGSVSITSLGGGGGGTNDGSGNGRVGNSGGSGGGGSLDVGGTARAGGVGTSGQGNNGGSGSNGSTFAGGGGGGAGAIGGNASGNTAGNGGNGTNAYATWLSTTGLGINGYIAGGGGGGGDNSGTTIGTGGFGGGGYGSYTSVAASGVASTGSGGGGGKTGTTGTGGSGLIIVRYAK